MPLREELAAAGTFLFRWRSYLPLAVMALVLWQMREFAHSGGSGLLSLAWEAVCLGTALFGLAIRAYVAAHIPRGTSGRNTRAQMSEELNTTGAYSVVRHPLYSGNFFIWLGVSLFPRVWWLSVMVALAFWLYYERIMYAEEEFLRVKFGRRYVRWAARTPAFLPDLRLFKKPVLLFSLRAALRREYSGFFGVIAVFTTLVWTRGWFQEGRLIPDPFWTALLGVGAGAYLALRYLKTHTPWLDAEGR